MIYGTEPGASAEPGPDGRDPVDTDPGNTEPGGDDGPAVEGPGNLPGIMPGSDG